MNAADVIRMLSEMDQQFISGRPSPTAQAAEIVQELCRRLNQHHPYSGIGLLGNFEAPDLSSVRQKRASRELWQPTLSLADENEKLRDDLEHAKTLVEILDVAPKTLIHRPGGCWDVFEDAIEGGKWLREREAAGDHVESFNVSHWNLHIDRRGQLPGMIDSERLDWLETCDLDDFKEVAWRWQRADKNARLRDVIDSVRQEPKGETSPSCD